MKISIITHTANPEEKQFPFIEALDSYLGLADEVIVVNGGKKLNNISDKVTVIESPDPEVWNWKYHALNLNKALEKASGDWIMWVAVDFILDEKYFTELKKLLERVESPVASMQKMSVYPFGKYKNKGATPQLINGKFKDKVMFGKDLSNYSDLTYPIYVDGWEDDLPVGKLVPESDWFKTGIPFWNFDYTFKTIEQTKKDFLRMSLSHKEYFGETLWGEKQEQAFAIFIQHIKECVEESTGDLGDGQILPKYIFYKWRRLRPDQLGFNGWGLI